MSRLHAALNRHLRFDDLVYEQRAREFFATTRQEELRQLCAAHGARFQAIDLRWGISEEASASAASGVR